MSSSKLVKRANWEEKMNLHRFGKSWHTDRVATVRDKSLENVFFPGQGKVREFQF